MAVKRTRYSNYILALTVAFVFFHLHYLRGKGSVDTAAEIIHDWPAHAKDRQQPSVSENATHDPSNETQPRPSIESEDEAPGTNARNIGDLIQTASERFEALVRKQTHTLSDAAIAYRGKRGRHPPPGFDAWHAYAEENNAIIVEEFWDQIYEDLEPFWAIPAPKLRSQARKVGMTVKVEDGSARATTDWFWHVIWARMIDKVAPYLSDMLIPLNPMDEPRVIVPWSEVTDMFTEADLQKHASLEQGPLTSNLTGWLENGDNDPVIPDITWSEKAPYSDARAACPPNSPVRQHNQHLALEEELSELSNTKPSDRTSAIEIAPSPAPVFVANSSESSNMCNDAAISHYHAALTFPLSVKTSTELIPMFGGSKIANVNNDILLPAPMYWNEDERFAGEDSIPWSDKSRKVAWRGTATGGRNRADNWRQFHRHRFVALTNGTKYENAESTSHVDGFFTSLWEMTAIRSLKHSLQSSLTTWLNKIMDIGFTDLFCDPEDPTTAEQPPGHCGYTNPHYRIMPIQKLTEQYQSKYLPDIDGNSFSGRYRTFLLSNSLPIKATLYREWHDSRLIAWKHFVPMNNRFDDFYRIMEYFAGCSVEECQEAIADHDKEAEAIATEGRDWARKTLRKVDMQIYVFRLLLEWGRLTDDNRDSLGWADDL